MMLGRSERGAAGRSAKGWYDRAGSFTMMIRDGLRNWGIVGRHLIEPFTRRSPSSSVP
jgi:hypothetical protein